MADLGAQLNSLSPEQRQALMVQAQQEANQSIMQEMMQKMVETCFTKCTGTSGGQLDSREQSCLGACQDRYLETRQHVQSALEKRQSSM